MTTTTIAHQTVRLDVRDANASESTFNDVNLSGSAFENVNMAGTVIRDANLTGVSITDAKLDGCTIEGIAVSELLACWGANRKGGDNA